MTAMHSLLQDFTTHLKISAHSYREYANDVTAVTSYIRSPFCVAKSEIMVKSCCAVQCANRCVPGCGLKFYRFPAGPKRRALWITKINRKNWQPNEYSWLCSSHFISGQKSNDPLSPDYVPSIFDYTSTPEKQKASADLVAYERRKESRKKRVNAAAMEETSAPKRRRCLADEGFRNAETMTDTSGCYMSWLEVENIRLSHENKQLDSECQVLRLQHQSCLTTIRKFSLIMLGLSLSSVN